MPVIEARTATQKQLDNVKAAAKAAGKTVTQFIKDWADKVRPK